MTETTTIKSQKINYPVTPLQIDEHLAAYINSLIDIKIAKIMDDVKPRFVTRQQIIQEIGRKGYEEGIRTGRLTPLAVSGRNSKIRINRREYEAYLTFLSIKQ